MTKQHKVAVDGEGLRNLAGNCRRAGTEDAWIDVALIWIDAAEPEIARLRAERDTLRQDAERLRDARLFPAGYELYRTSEIIAERKDAERYRLLRDNAPDQMCVRIWQQITRYGIAQPDSRLSGNALDAAIDAALKEPK